jgi:hypothetical protein
MTPPISLGHSEDDTANAMALDQQEPTDYPVIGKWQSELGFAVFLGWYVL